MSEDLSRTLNQIIEAAEAVLTNEEHAFTGGMRSYKKGSPTWQCYEDLRIAIVKHHQRPSEIPSQTLIEQITKLLEDALFDEWYEKPRELAAKIEELMLKENFALAANQCHHGYGDDFGNHRCKYQDEIEKLKQREIPSSKLIQTLEGYRKDPVLANSSLAQLALNMAISAVEKDRPSEIPLNNHIGDDTEMVARLMCPYPDEEDGGNPPRKAWQYQVGIANKILHALKWEMVNPQNKEAAALIERWLQEPGTYDEETWAKIKPLIEDAKPAREMVPSGHVLYKTGDNDVPTSICDANGGVALSMCKVCGKGEIELEGLCISKECRHTFEISGSQRPGEWFRCHKCGHRSDNNLIEGGS